ncbi:MAG TPA: SufE family protein [Pirellulaceae bacterium]|jgi:cysteine desulfuration protein SufE|nr:SufE family protein [Pirellulaceae bacterium]
MITVEELIEDFAEFEDWQDRYRYLLEMGDDLPDYPEEEKTDTNLVQGCQSRVWMTADVDDSPAQKLHLQADSDSAIVKGLIAILVALYDDRPAREVNEVPIESVFQQIGLGQRLSPQRSNGFYAMVNRIRDLAANRR